MWFKNLAIYPFTEKFTVKPEELAETLTSNPFIPCGRLIASSMGWVAPIGKEDAPLVHAANGFMMLCLRIEEKILPSTVVREQVQEKVEEIENSQARKVYKKEKERIKDEVYQDLLPRAFTRSTRLYAYIDPKDGWLVVNTSSRKKAEEFITFLRQTIGSFKVALPETQTPAVIMTDWLKNNTNYDEFTIEDSCVLKSIDEEGGTVRCQKQDLLSENIQNFIEERCQVTQLQLSWSDQISFHLKDDFSIRSIRYLDTVLEQADDVLTETEEERFDADFTIMTMTFRLFIQGLMEIFALDETKELEKIAAVETKSEAVPA